MLEEALKEIKRGIAEIIDEEKIEKLLKDYFENGKNYLEFQNPNECIEQTVSLYADDEKRYEMMISNAEYYYKYLYPFQGCVKEPTETSCLDGRLRHIHNIHQGQ